MGKRMPGIGNAPTPAGRYFVLPGSGEPQVAIAVP